MKNLLEIGENLKDIDLEEILEASRDKV